LLAKAQAGRSALLIAPTGAGKTLAGFLPSLVDLARRGPVKPGEPVFGPHTLYVSPLKALAVDIQRNLELPVGEIGLPIRLETRTGDTPLYKRQRQKLDPPDILLTTPEQVALLIASRDARRLFGRLRTVIFDELHSLVVSKRGDLLSSALPAESAFTRPAHHRPVGHRGRTGRSLRLARGARMPARSAGSPTGSSVEGGAAPELSILESDDRVPWQGHTARYALPEVYEAIKAHKTTLLFVNTRWQAELLFSELWRINEDSLPIALHHGSLDRGQRRKVEAAMAAGQLRAVVATSTLDLGIDWGDVDLVVHVGAPKGASRLAQRIGRANHRMDEPSKGMLVPANRFEVLECRAALDANYLGHQDTPPLRPGALDVLCQHILGMAVAEPFDAVALHDEMTAAEPYRTLTWETFEKCVDFVATGGYALRTYERYAKIRRRKDGPLKGLWGISHPSVAQQYRLNVGTIVEAPMLKVVLGRPRKGVFRGGRVLGEIEESFLEMLRQGDAFQFSGRTLRFEGIRENVAYCTIAQAEDPQIPAYAGGKFPLTTYLAAQVRAILADPKRWSALPTQVCEWLQLQQEKSLLPGASELLVETFPHRGKFYMTAFPFEGRLAHQTLGMLLTRRLERAGARPLGFVATGLFARRLGPARSGRDLRLRAPEPCHAVRRGHARRRPGSLDGRLVPAEAHVPQLRRHFRADRAPPSRPGKDGPAGHRFHRSGLRRAAHPRTRPHPAAGDPGRCRHRPARHPALGRNAVSREGPNRASAAGARFAAVRPRHAGDRTRVGVRRGADGHPGGCGRRADPRSHGRRDWDCRRDERSSRTGRSRGACLKRG
jgi:ATP-dependent Lhr-like helicase